MPPTGRTVLQGPRLQRSVWGHFSVTCGNVPLCAAHRAGNIVLEFFPNTQQVWGQDNGPVGGGRGPGAPPSATRQEPLSREPLCAAELGEAAKAAGARVGPSTRRPADAALQLRPSRLAPQPRAAQKPVRSPVWPAAPTCLRPCVHSRLPCPGEHCSVPRGTWKFENEGGK